MQGQTGDYIVELNCLARRAHLWAWSDLIPNDTERSMLLAIARRCLNQFWQEHDGDLEPKVAPTASFAVPDEVIIKTTEGRAICSWNIVQERNARYRAA
jgi:hypothetical protein